MEAFILDISFVYLFPTVVFVLPGNIFKEQNIVRQIFKKKKSFKNKYLLKKVSFLKKVEIS